MKKIFKSNNGETAFHKSGNEYINEKGDTAFHKSGADIINRLGDKVARVNSDDSVSDSAGNSIGTIYNGVLYDTCGNPILEE